MHRSDAKIRGRPSAGGLLLFLACLAAAPQQEILQKGRQLLQEGRFQEALVQASEFKQNAPQDARGYHLAGLALAAAGRGREAASEFAAAVQRDPERLEYRLRAAASLARIGQAESALKMLQPYDGDNLSRLQEPLVADLLAELYERRQQNEPALAALERLAQIQPVNSGVDVRIGRIHLVEGRFEAARQAFQNALEKQPDSGAALQGLGLSLARLGKTEDARQALMAAVKAAPEDPSHLLDLGKLLLETGETSQAVELLQRAAAQAEAPPEAFYELARAYRRTGDLDQARLNLEKFQSIDRRRQQERADARRLEGLLKTAQDRLQEGKVKEARDAFDQAVAIDPDNWAAHSFLAKIYLSSNLLPQARRHLLEMRRIDPESAEGNFLLASYWYRDRRLQQALELALQAKQRRPDYGELRNLLGNILFSLGRRAEARAEYAAAVGLEPERQDFRRNYEAARDGN